MAVREQKVPSFLKALGRKPFAGVIELRGQQCTLICVLKHDFFAATGLYRCADGRRVVLKIGRQGDLLGLPARWVGRFLCARESRIYRALADVPQVPAFSGYWEDTGFAHEYVEGDPLRRDQAVAEDFFDRLAALIDVIHARGMAYVDLEKSENIIVGDDGLPYLIDFQISWNRPGWILSLLQRMDRYHLLKHRNRYLKSAEPTQDQTAAPPPLSIRLHRALVRPLQKIRRKALKKLDPDHAQTSERR